MLEYVVKKGRTCVEGTETLRWKIRFPSWDSQHKSFISDFYAEVASRVEHFCTNVLSDRARSEFEASDDPKKRFRFVPLLYDLNVFVTYEDEDIISVLLTVRFCRGAENVKVMTDAHMWQVTDAKLLPPKQVYDLLRVKRPSNKKMRKCVGISYDGKTLKQYEKKYEKKVKTKNGY